MKDSVLQVQLANVATSLDMGRNGFAAKAFPEYLVEMRRTKPASYIYEVSIDGVKVDDGKYHLRTGGMGIVDRWPDNDPYGEVARENMLALDI